MANSPSVLIVEDEPLIAMLLAEWLTELGCQAVGPAGRVSEAVEFIDTGAIDAVLLDVTLGPEDSFSLADHAENKGLPVAFLTGKAIADLPERFQGHLILSKPYVFDDLQVLIGELLPALQAQSDD